MRCGCENFVQKRLQTQQNPSLKSDTEVLARSLSDFVPHWEETKSAEEQPPPKNHRFLP